MHKEPIERLFIVFNQLLRNTVRKKETLSPKKYFMKSQCGKVEPQENNMQIPLQPTLKKFRQINYLVISFVKPLL